MGEVVLEKIITYLVSGREKKASHLVSENMELARTTLVHRKVLSVKKTKGWEDERTFIPVWLLGHPWYETSVAL